MLVLGPKGVPRGVEHKNAKLDDDAVREIRRLHEAGYGYHRIAAHFGVSPSCIERVVKRQTWAHVE